MSVKLIAHRLTRRRFIERVGQGAFLASLAASRLARANTFCPAGTSTACTLRLAATDGHFVLPGREADVPPDPYLHHGPVYGFGFVEALTSDSIGQVTAKHKGKVQWPAPIIAVDENDGLFLTLTNLGLVVRIDLTDSHTIHWHGFRNAISLFDGVPEVSIAVPIARDFPYFYPPRAAGTYMYHCHFEDVEHVQMGMQSIVFVRPDQNKTGNPAGAPIARLGGNPGSPVLGYAYNDGVNTSNARSTAYDREFGLLLNEVWTTAHDNLEAIQENNFTDYQPNYWIINGRSYPHTILRGTDPTSEAFPALAIDDDDGKGPSLRQPISSLIQVNANNRVLLRFVNLGYQQHAMQLPGIRMKVIAEDATLLRGPTGVDLSYMTNTIYIGPGESRDVLFRAPAYRPAAAISDGSLGNYNRYLLMNRNVHRLNNNGATEPNGLGGMVTELRVYQSPLPPQSEPNETYAPV